MKIAKRIFLFLAVNILVMITISLTLNVLGIRPYLSANGIDYSSLMAFCAVWGFGGAFISLGLSRIMAKWMMGVQVIDPRTTDLNLRNLVQRVHGMSRAAGLSTMPEVGIYESPDLNAFATGPTKNRALVAVSTGLLHSMSEREVDGVLAHEISHVTNGDMVTMTLVQGVVNAFVMFFARAIAYAASQFVKEDLQRVVHFALVIVLEIVFSLLGAMVVAYFSRIREYRADAGGARLSSRENMIAALEALKRNFQIEEPETPATIQTLKISGRGAGLMAMFASHPPLDERIKRLQRGA